MTNNVFGGLSTEGLEESQDRIGGNRIVEAGPLTGKIKLAYAGKASASMARSVTIVLAHGENGNQEYRETFWVTNKKGENFWLSKDDAKKKNPLPGFTIVDDICLVTTNKPLSEQPAEDKVINLYDFDQKKEVPTAVPMLVELIGKDVTLGIQKHLKNKQVKSQSTGEFEDTADSREENVTDKVFHYPSNLTVVEARKGVQKAGFYPAWVEKNAGQTQDRRSIKDGVSAQGGRTGRPNGAGGPPKSGESAAKTNSLFSPAN
jgi:hypothetical protein